VRNQLAPDARFGSTRSCRRETSPVGLIDRVEVEATLIGHSLQVVEGSKTASAPVLDQLAERLVDPSLGHVAPICRCASSRSASSICGSDCGRSAISVMVTSPRTV
jgi:hypothetical protein